MLRVAILHGRPAGGEAGWGGSGVDAAKRRIAIGEFSIFNLQFSNNFQFSN